ncbi:MAG: hypothetical protein CVU22_16060 [Betaproteobacteria bacterium HGW-Betaproteobacteria-16]|nr:MAG: hypothetical protein CVU22_16060 [Betaproteobacteria bacterium HGW-Betaproteobacteria-16]
MIEPLNLFHPGSGQSACPHGHRWLEARGAGLPIANCQLPRRKSCSPVLPPSSIRLSMNAMLPVSDCHDSLRSRCDALRVLITDQEVEAAEILAMVMSHEGHTVAVARDAGEALQLTDLLRPDVSILDIGMPGLDGRRVAQRIRQTPWGASNLIVALTGFGEEVDGLCTRGSDFDEHFTKPVAPSRLLCRIAAWRHIRCHSFHR